MAKILVAEDEPEMIEMITLRLESDGHQVVEATNGLEAYRLASDGSFDLIITDVLMPVLDGYHLYKKIKESKLTEGIPVLVMTAHGKMEDTFRAVGVDDFIAKPFANEQLLTKVNAILGHKKQPVQTKARDGFRVLIAGEGEEVIEKMGELLSKTGCHTDLVTSAAQVISKAVLFLPNLLLIEVQMEEMAPSDVISVLRKMPQCENIPILTYSFYRMGDLGNEDIRQKALSVDADQEHCQEAGATKYIGRFNENSFLNEMKPYLR